MLHLNFWTKGNCWKLRKRLRVTLFSTWRITLSIYMLLISMKPHFKSILKGTMFWMYQRKQLADEGRLLEDGTHGDTNFLEVHEASGARPWTPHHALCRPRHLTAGQWSSSLVSFPSPLSPSFPYSPALSSATRRPSLDFAFCLQKRDTEKDFKGSHASLQAVSISLAKLGHHTLCLKHNRWI